MNIMEPNARPLNPGRLYHFNVIYNYARCPLSTTEDTQLSKAWTQQAVKILHQHGLVSSYYHDRDCSKGQGMVQELSRVIAASEVTLVLLSPGFVRDCWPRYWLLSCFRSLFQDSSGTPSSTFGSSSYSLASSSTSSLTSLSSSTSSTSSGSRRGSDAGSQVMLVALGLQQADLPVVVRDMDVLFFPRGWQHDRQTWGRLARGFSSEEMTVQHLEDQFKEEHDGPCETSSPLSSPHGDRSGPGTSDANSTISSVESGMKSSSEDHKEVKSSENSSVLHMDVHDGITDHLSEHLRAASTKSFYGTETLLQTEGCLGDGGIEKFKRVGQTTEESVTGTLTQAKQRKEEIGTVILKPPGSCLEQSDSETLKETAENTKVSGTGTFIQTGQFKEQSDTERLKHTGRSPQESSTVVCKQTEQKGEESVADTVEDNGTKTFRHTGQSSEENGHEALKHTKQNRETNSSVENGSQGVQTTNDDVESAILDRLYHTGIRRENLQEHAMTRVFVHKNTVSIDTIPITASRAQQVEHPPAPLENKSTDTGHWPFHTRNERGQLTINGKDLHTDRNSSPADDIEIRQSAVRSQNPKLSSQEQFFSTQLSGRKLQHSEKSTAPSDVSSTVAVTDERFEKSKNTSLESGQRSNARITDNGRHDDESNRTKIPTLSRPDGTTDTSAYSQHQRTMHSYQTNSSRKEDRSVPLRTESIDSSKEITSTDQSTSTTVNFNKHGHNTQTTKSRFTSQDVRGHSSPRESCKVQSQTDYDENCLHRTRDIRHDQLQENKAKLLVCESQDPQKVADKMGSSKEVGDTKITKEAGETKSTAQTKENVTGKENKEKLPADDFITSIEEDHDFSINDLSISWTTSDYGSASPPNDLSFVSQDSGFLSGGLASFNDASAWKNGSGLEKRDHEEFAVTDKNEKIADPQFASELRESLQQNETKPENGILKKSLTMGASFDYNSGTLHNKQSEDKNVFDSHAEKQITSSLPSEQSSVVTIKYNPQTPRGLDSKVTVTTENDVSAQKPRDIASETTITKRHHAIFHKAAELDSKVTATKDTSLHETKGLDSKATAGKEHEGSFRNRRDHDSELPKTKELDIGYQKSGDIASNAAGIKECDAFQKTTGFDSEMTLVTDHGVRFQKTACDSKVTVVRESNGRVQKATGLISKATASGESDVTLLETIAKKRAQRQQTRVKEKVKVLAARASCSSEADITHAMSRKDSWTYCDIDKRWTFLGLLLPVYRILCHALSRSEMPYFWDMQD